jgi:putative Holliday junction resolvase
MRILGIDYGRKKIGLALATSKIAEPYVVLRVHKAEEALKKIKDIVGKEKIEKVVIGVSEGKMAGETMEFAGRLEKKLKIPIGFQDETLTSLEAQKRAIEAKVKKKKRKEMEDAYSAALILQAYIDNTSSLKE